MTNIINLSDYQKPKNTMSFRQEDGEWMEKKPNIIQSAYNTVYDVVHTYASLISSLLTFAIKIGIFVALFPFVKVGITAFASALHTMMLFDPFN